MKKEIKSFTVDRVEEEKHNTTLDAIRDIAKSHTMKILSEIGILPSDIHYSENHYELQHNIYNAIKGTLKL